MTNQHHQCMCVRNGKRATRSKEEEDYIYFYPCFVFEKKEEKKPSEIKAIGDVFRYMLIE